MDVEEPLDNVEDEESDDDVMTPEQKIEHDKRVEELRKAQDASQKRSRASIDKLRLSVPKLKQTLTPSSPTEEKKAEKVPQIVIVSPKVASPKMISPRNSPGDEKGLETKLLKSQLSTALQNRSSTSDLKARNILRTQSGDFAKERLALAKTNSASIMFPESVGLDLNYVGLLPRHFYDEKVRSKQFLLLRSLLRFADTLHELKEIDEAQRRKLKSLILVKDKNVLKAAAGFNHSKDYVVYRDALMSCLKG